MPTNLFVLALSLTTELGFTLRHKPDFEAYQAKSVEQTLLVICGT